mmetsp:Transcript_2253/g.3109  ORF Transcript_2253/g.3109 Transcript_2253/m.3109 type:complete len:573 (+) Transcript_2253:244-1962(+)|eukprot:CAMPEP_0117754562 /NCGR_PEP_ID=MMETSP0947-20121206/12899_1 /TAXON_ID=44440 /ORGANISM="Chattonella subsalsa, Strain CCMP2191" /LENGTH=572 /DNA_ID=CAMNT_0005573667 /DNA_START=240 /DNA_END=1958 /DNA_ORIENTATION=+
MNENLDEQTKQVIEGLKHLYHTKLKPLEELYRYDLFHSPILTDAEFDAKPQVLMIGQYSTGKTSFIRYILGRDFPGQRIGPEPTTDRFVTVMHGSEDRVIPGNALAVHPELPYRGLERFGVAFLNRLEGSQMPCPVLKNISIVDTPGILSGEKQRVQRGYDFQHVVQWFVERADLVLLLFDAHKLDISDEFQTVIQKLKGHEDKIRCVLNKADQIDRQKLMRVYGALMWSMGKVLKTPEVLRVYVGSFWDEPLYYDENAQLFEMEERDLMHDLRMLPRNSALRKINELVKRTRLAKVHAYIIGYLKSQMPMMSREKKQKKMIEDLPSVFRTVMKTYNLAPGDFPDIDMFREKLREMNFSKFSKLKTSVIAKVDGVLTADIPRLMELLPKQMTAEQMAAAGLVIAPPAVSPVLANPSQQSLRRGSSQSSSSAPPPPVPVQAPPQPYESELPRSESPNPFMANTSPIAFNPFQHGDDGAEPWALEDQREEYIPQFEACNPENGKLPAGQARDALMATGLDINTLRVVWDLSDIDKDGMLDLEEFILAMYLCKASQSGEELDEELPIELIPPSKR